MTRPGAAGRPEVSVLICAHDRLAFLKKTLASALAQRRRGLEVVVVDDGSSDGTFSWLSRLRDPRVLALRLSPARGPAGARNAGLAQCRGELVAFLDHDDLWRPGYLKAAAVALARAGAQVCVSDFRRIDARGRVLPLERPPAPGPLDRLCGIRGAPLPSALVVRRSALLAVGGFDESFRLFGDDMDLAARLARRFGRRAFRTLPRPYVLYRRHEGQLTDFSDASGRVRSGAGGAPGARERERLLDMIALVRRHRFEDSPGPRAQRGK